MLFKWRNPETPFSPQKKKIYLFKAIVCEDFCDAFYFLPFVLIKAHHIALFCYILFISAILIPLNMGVGWGHPIDLICTKFHCYNFISLNFLHSPTLILAKASIFIFCASPHLVHYPLTSHSSMYIYIYIMCVVVVTVPDCVVHRTQVHFKMFILLTQIKRWVGI